MFTSVLNGPCIVYRVILSHTKCVKRSWSSVYEQSLENRLEGGGAADNIQSVRYKNWETTRSDLGLHVNVVSQSIKLLFINYCEFPAHIHCTSYSCNPAMRKVQSRKDYYRGIYSITNMLKSRFNHSILNDLIFRFTDSILNDLIFRFKHSIFIN